MQLVCFCKFPYQIQLSETNSLLKSRNYLSMLKLKFRFTSNHKDGFSPNGVLDSIFIDLTSRCNFSCRYCFNTDCVQADALDLPISAIRKMILDIDKSKI